MLHQHLLFPPSQLPALELPPPAVLADAPVPLWEHLPLAPMTSYLVGGPARYYAEPRSVDEVGALLLWARRRALQVLVIGKGSNLVVSDRGFDGLVLSLNRHLSALDYRDLGHGRVELAVGAGAALWDVVLDTVSRGLRGMERMVGIPGTIGGGVYINAGAFDQEIIHSCAWVESISRDGVRHRRLARECGFAYRRSHFFDWDEVIVRAGFELVRANPVVVRKDADEIWQRRKSRQPLDLPNAGSMFKRPPGTFAGKLIEDAGLKGHRLGGAQISPRHSNFVVNAGGATAQDIHALSMDVIRRVEAHSGIRMEREQIFIGAFED